MKIKPDILTICGDVCRVSIEEFKCTSTNSHPNIVEGRQIVTAILKLFKHTHEEIGILLGQHTITVTRHVRNHEKAIYEDGDYKNKFDLALDAYIDRKMDELKIMKLWRKIP